jgi:hypothetical protein
MNAENKGVKHAWNDIDCDFGFSTLGRAAKMAA